MGKGGGWRLSGVECREEKEESEGHDEDVGAVARQAHGAQAFAALAVAQLAVDVRELLQCASGAKS